MHFIQHHHTLEPIQVDYQKLEDLHGDTIRNGHNKSGANSSFGRGGERISCPTPIIWVETPSEHIQRYTQTEQILHYQRKQAIISTNNQKKCEIRCSDALLDASD